MRTYTDAEVEIIALIRLGHEPNQIEEYFKELGLAPPPARKVKLIADAHESWLLNQKQVLEARHRHSQEIREKQERLAKEKEAKRERKAQQRGKTLAERLIMARLPL